MLDQRKMLRKFIVGDMDKLKPTGVNPIRFDSESGTLIQPSNPEFSAEMSEESKRRLMARINSDLDKSLKQFKGNINTQDVRDSMVRQIHEVLSGYMENYDSHIDYEAKQGPNDTLIMSMTAKDRIGQSIILRMQLGQLESMIERSGSEDLMREFSAFGSLLIHYLDHE